MSSTTTLDASMAQSKVGRPTKFGETIQAKADEYASNFMAYGDPVPSVAGLADALNVSRKSIYNWAEDHPDFLHTLDRIENRQHKFLIAGGLSNEFNAGITKLMLHNHGYSDKISSDHTTQGEKIDSIGWTVTVPNAS